jgi:hypothetical protein
MRGLFAVGIGLLIGAAIARADDLGSGSRPAGTSGNCDSCGARVGTGLTVGPDPFRSGNQVVRDRDTGRPLYRVEPDPFHPGWQRIDNYNTGKPLAEVRPDPFNVDQSVVDPR